MACPICGDEYKSETGRDRHMSQMHAASQDVTCVGCGKVFVRAGGLMAHVEQNECPVLSKDLLAWNRTRKLIQKIEEERVPDILTNSRDLFPSRLPPLANKNQGSQAFSAKDDPVLGVAQLSISNLEKLNPISLGAKNDDAKSVDLLTDPADESVAGFNSLWDDRIPEKPTSLVEPADSIANANDREEGEVVKGEDPRDPTSPNFQPDKFWHAIHKKFSCPYLGCG
ncbi:MAG: hypothetical protein M1829_006082 [Trizodia sp. TS-e1964]|nr:MAG: hypothetical protein M1829_006082 [Trizodia sp. TS-e1964]